VGGFPPAWRSTPSSAGNQDQADHLRRERAVLDHPRNGAQSRRTLPRVRYLEHVHVHQSRHVQLAGGLPPATPTTKKRPAPATRSTEPLRPYSKPVGSRAHPRRLLRWLGRGGRRGHAANRPRERWRRVDPCAGGVQWPRRPEASTRADLDGPEVRESFLAVNGVLTRTVTDRAAVLDVLASYEPGDSSWAPTPSERFAAQAAPMEVSTKRAASSDSPRSRISLGAASDQSADRPRRRRPARRRHAHRAPRRRG
jgi:hypothetical protein